MAPRTDRDYYLVSTRCSADGRECRRADCPSATSPAAMGCRARRTSPRRCAPSRSPTDAAPCEFRETRAAFDLHNACTMCRRSEPCLNTFNLAVAVTGAPMPLSAEHSMLMPSSSICTGSMRSDTEPPVIDTRRSTGGVTRNLHVNTVTIVA